MVCAVPWHVSWHSCQKIGAIILLRIHSHLFQDSNQHFELKSSSAQCCNSWHLYSLIELQAEQHVKMMIFHCVSTWESYTVYAGEGEGFIHIRFLLPHWDAIALDNRLMAQEIAVWVEATCLRLAPAATCQIRCIHCLSVWTSPSRIRQTGFLLDYSSTHSHVWALCVNSKAV